jgi:hypothetical protein
VNNFQSLKESKYFRGLAVHGEHHLHSSFFPHSVPLGETRSCLFFGHTCAHKPKQKLVGLLIM